MVTNIGHAPEKNPHNICVCYLNKLSTSIKFFRRVKESEYNEPETRSNELSEDDEDEDDDEEEYSEEEEEEDGGVEQAQEESVEEEEERLGDWFVLHLDICNL